MGWSLTPRVWCPSATTRGGCHAGSPGGRLRGGTGGARTLPTWADRKGRASLVPLSRLQLLGVVRTGVRRERGGGGRVGGR